MLILKTIICGRHLEENYKVTAQCTLSRFESRPFCVCDQLPALGAGWQEHYWMCGGKGRKQSPESEEEEPSRNVCVPCLLACLQAGKKKMKFSSVLFLWQIQLLWGLVQSGVTSKRQKLKTWQLMKWQMTRKFRQGPSVGSNTWRKTATIPSAFPKPLSHPSPGGERRPPLPSLWLQLE